MTFVNLFVKPLIKNIKTNKNKYIFILFIGIFIILILKWIYNIFIKRNFIQRYLGIIDKCKPEQSGIDTKIKHIYNNSDNSDIKGIIATCLYGDDTKKTFNKYLSPLLEKITMLKRILPKWKCRVYLDPNISKKTLDMLINTGCEVYVMYTPNIRHEASLWRFLPAKENLPFLCVDADKSPLIDDKLPLYIKEWMDSDCVFFKKWQGIIPITAGMWGGKPNSVNLIEKMMNNYCTKKFGSDEIFLTKYIWPIFKKKGYYTTPMISGIIDLINE